MSKPPWDDIRKEPWEELDSERNPSFIPSAVLFDLSHRSVEYSILNGQSFGAELCLHKPDLLTEEFYSFFFLSLFLFLYLQWI